jgi:hypothetical protein
MPIDQKKELAAFGLNELGGKPIGLVATLQHVL